MSGALVGVDLGGTLIRAAVATGATTHGPLVRHPTPATGGPEAVLDAVAAAVREATGGETPGGVAIGIPGPLDPATGMVYTAPNLAGWHDVAAGGMLRERVGSDIAVQNDARLAGFAEWTAGAGRGTRHFIFMTASTGIGGGLVIGGELHAGTAGTAGELGHMIADPNGPGCTQGHRGCLEGIASGTGMVHRARLLLEGGATSSLSAVPADGLDARAIEDHANAGDALARQLFDDAGRALGLAIGGLINELSPEVVAIGGGLSQAGDLLFAPLLAAVPDMAFAVPLSRCRIVPAQLGTDAGMVGAIAWAGRCFGPPPTAASPP
ncbi:MAG: ROK family protein [Chloroflexi bacterium]|nr:MAG: ROK family protein [Chloroflexota bacterium]